LFVRQGNVKANAAPAVFKSTAVGGFHQSRAAAGYYGKAVFPFFYNEFVKFPGLGVIVG
jgi:hypothetical protein